LEVERRREENFIVQIDLDLKKNCEKIVFYIFRTVKKMIVLFIAKVQNLSIFLSLSLSIPPFPLSLHTCLERYFN